MKTLQWHEIFLIFTQEVELCLVIKETHIKNFHKRCILSEVFKTFGAGWSRKIYTRPTFEN